MNMATLIAQKSIFDMTPEELHDYLKPTAQKLKQTALDNGSWYSYRNDLCTNDDMFIREFKDGRKELIKLGNKTGEFTLLRVL